MKFAPKKKHNMERILLFILKGGLNHEKNYDHLCNNDGDDYDDQGKCC